MTTVIDEFVPRQRVGAVPLGRTSHRHRTTVRQRVAFAVTLAVIAVWHLYNIGGFPAFADDEGTYFSQAWAVQHGALAPYTYWYDHPPAGWIQIALVSWIPKLFGVESIVAGRIVMVLCTLLTAALVYRLALNVGMRRSVALGAMLLWALSPLVVSQARMIYLDNVAVPWVLLAFVLATSRKRDLWYHTCAGLALAVGILSKETVAPAVVALVVALAAYAYPRIRSFSIMGALVLGGLALLLYPAFAAVRKELLPGPHHVSLWDALVFQFSSRAGSGFILDPASGAHGQLMGWLGLDSVLLVVGGICAVATLASKRLRFLGVAVLLAVVIALRPNGYLPGMYVIASLPLVALCIAGVVDKLWSVCATLDGVVWRRVTGAILVLVVTLGVASFAPAWAAKTRVAFTAEENANHQPAVDWVAAHVDHRAVVLVDNTYWNDLVDRGFSSDGFHGAMWFYKPDTDSSFDKAYPPSRYPHAYQALDYMIWTKTIAADPNALPRVREALEHSTVVTTFGSGEDRVEIRKLIKDGATK